MKKRRFAVIVALTIIVSSLAMYLFYNFFIIQDIEAIKFDVIITNYTGFNLDQDKLHFGSIQPGSEAHREITIDAEADHRVSIDVRGVDFVYPKENNFKIRKGEPRKVLMIAAPPEGTTEGLYEGTILVISKRP